MFLRQWLSYRTIATNVRINLSLPWLYYDILKVGVLDFINRLISKDYGLCA